VKYALLAAALFFPAIAAAQTPPQDPKLSIAMQLLNERTSQVIELAAQMQTLNTQLQELRAENAKLKAEQPKK